MLQVPRSSRDHTDRRLRPFARRRERTARPCRVRMRTRKPWVFLRRRLLGWNVRLLTAIPLIPGADDASVELLPISTTGGEGGIRTHGSREGSTVFETAPFDHSGTSPNSAPLTMLNVPLLNHGLHVSRERSERAPIPRSPNASAVRGWDSRPALRASGPESAGQNPTRAAISERSEQMAERVGFEPTVGFPHTHFPGVHLRPLGHLSGSKPCRNPLDPAFTPPAAERRKNPSTRRRTPPASRRWSLRADG